MAVDVTLDSLSSGYNISKINSNFTAIDVALQDALSRSGTLPNNMLSDLDMDGNSIINVDALDVQTLTLDGVPFVDAAHVQGPPGANGTNGTNGAAATIAVGTVTTGAAGSSVIITNAGSSSAAIFNFTIPRGNTGASGAGTGDMVASQNLNDVASKPTSFDTIKQAATATYTGVVELATSAETITGSDTVRATTPAGVKASTDLIASAANTYTDGQITSLRTIMDLLVPVGAIIQAYNTGGASPFNSSFWLQCGGLTIGDATSGGTARANADTLNLFTVLWNATDNADVVIQNSSGVITVRGASALADFNVHKRMPLPSLNGNIFIRGRGSRNPGNVQVEQLGPHSHTASTSSSGSHNHTMNAGGSHSHTLPVVDDGGNPGHIGAANSERTIITDNVPTNAAGSHTHVINFDGSHTHTITVNANSGTENRPENTAVNYWIRY